MTEVNDNGDDAIVILVRSFPYKILKKIGTNE